MSVHSQRIAGMSKVLGGCIIVAQHNRNTLPTRLCIPMYDDKLDKQAVQELLRLIYSNKRIDSMQQMIKMTKQQELLVRITVLAGKYDMLNFPHQLDFALAACCNDARAPAIPDSIHIALAEVAANGTVHLPNYMRFWKSRFQSPEKASFLADNVANLPIGTVLDLMQVHVANMIHYRSGAYQ